MAFRLLVRRDSWKRHVIVKHNFVFSSVLSLVAWAQFGGGVNESDMKVKSLSNNSKSLKGEFCLVVSTALALLIVLDRNSKEGSVLLILDFTKQT